MTKKPGKRPGMPANMGGGMPNMNALMAQFNKMQQDMQEAQAALETEELEVSVGGGALTIVITGHQRIKSIVLNKELIDTSEDSWVEDLQDLLVAAVNQAIEQSQTRAAERMEAISGGLGGTGLGGLLGM